MDLISLDNLKKMVNSSKSKLELLSLHYYHSPSLEEFLRFASPGFPCLRGMKLTLTGQLTFEDLLSYIRLHLSLSKLGVFKELLLSVRRLNITDYHSIVIEGIRVPRVEEYVRS